MRRARPGMASADLGKRLHSEHDHVRSASIPLNLALAFLAGILGARITLLADVELRWWLAWFFLGSVVLF